MERFNSLIRSMPVDEQAFTSKQSTWSQYFNGYGEASNILQHIFNNKNSVQISRLDLFRLAQKDDLGYLIIATILWGYPRGMRGNYFSSILSQFQQIKDALLEAQVGIDNWLEHYKKIKKIEGLGLSTYTKFLYFMGATVENHSALILDKRIIDTLQRELFIELNPISHISIHTAVSKYPLYLGTMDSLSQSVGTESDKIEMFLFEFGLNLKIESESI